MSKKVLMLSMVDDDDVMMLPLPPEGELSGLLGLLPMRTWPLPCALDEDDGWASPVLCDEGVKEVERVLILESDWGDAADMLADAKLGLLRVRRGRWYWMLGSSEDCMFMWLEYIPDPLAFGGTVV